MIITRPGTTLAPSTTVAGGGVQTHRLPDNAADWTPLYNARESGWYKLQRLTLDGNKAAQEGRVRLHVLKVGERPIDNPGRARQPEVSLEGVAVVDALHAGVYVIDGVLRASGLSGSGCTWGELAVVGPARVVAEDLDVNYINIEMEQPGGCSVLLDGGVVDLLEVTDREGDPVDGWFEGLNIGDIVGACGSSTVHTKACTIVTMMLDQCGRWTLEECSVGDIAIDFQTPYRTRPDQRLAIEGGSVGSVTVRGVGTLEISGVSGVDLVIDEVLGKLDVSLVVDGVAERITTPTVRRIE